MLDTIRENRAIAAKFIDAGFFWSDLEHDTGITSKPLRRLGLSDRELRDGSYQLRIHPDDRSTYFAVWERVEQGRDDTLYVEYRLADEHGDWHWIETHAVVILRRADGRVAQIVGTDRNINGRKNAQLYLERQVREASRKLEVAESLLVAGTITSAEQELAGRLHEGMVRLAEIVAFHRCAVHIVDDADHRCVAAYPDTGCDDEPTPDVVFARIRESRYPVITDDDPALGPYRSSLAIPLVVGDTLVGALFLWHSDSGFYRSVDLFTGLSVATVFAVALYNHQFYRRTVSELERDELTTFLTRKSFDRDAPAIWREYRELYRENAVAMLDIDRFKTINDRYGHQRGDDVIRAVAGVLKAGLRQDDVLGRYGGEEFVAILPNCSRQAARETMERIRRACEALDVCEFAGNVTISIGVAVIDRGDAADATGAAGAARAGLDALIAAADRALYRAKTSGRNRVVLAD